MDIKDIRLEIFQNHEKNLSKTSTTKLSDIWSVARWWWNDRQGEVRGLRIVYWFQTKKTPDCGIQRQKTLLSSLSDNECISYKGRIKMMQSVILCPCMCMYMHECVSTHVWEDSQTHTLCVCVFTWLSRPLQIT